ncbi:hypothetical protein R6Q59_014150 [Mikania micrantha]
MSQIHAKSPQHCAQKKLINITNLHKKLLITIFTSILLIILIFWLILHPTKPQFSLKQADINRLVVSETHLLNSSIQLTLVAINPNRQVGIFYDEMQVYASYKAQQITGHSYVAPFYQDCKDSDVLSAMLVANDLPVAPSLNYDLGRDQMAGRLVLNIKTNGLIRWKVGVWVSGKYRFGVSCVAVLGFGPLSYKQGAHCSTTI